MIRSYNILKIIFTTTIIIILIGFILTKSPYILLSIFIPFLLIVVTKYILDKDNIKKDIALFMTLNLETHFHLKTIHNIISV